jgi:hypothetical protein
VKSEYHVPTSYRPGDSFREWSWATVTAMGFFLRLRRDLQDQFEVEGRYAPALSRKLDAVEVLLEST